MEMPINALEQAHFSARIAADLAETMHQETQGAYQKAEARLRECKERERQTRERLVAAKEMALFSESESSRRTCGKGEG